MDYQTRINNVIDFIGLNIDSELTLEQLSEVACFSKYHFHRLFTAYTGLSLRQYIKWLRLKRAAHQLNTHKNRNIIEIALDAGFESHESFARAFKKAGGQTPNEFRKRPGWDLWNQPPYSLQTIQETTMNVTIKELPAKRLAVLEHHGDFKKLGDTIDQMREWTRSQSINLKPKPDTRYGYAYNDPFETPTDEFRHDIGILVPESFKIEGGPQERYLPAGRYAIATHKGSRNTVGDTVYALYQWASNKGQELADLPCIFCYQNFEHEVAETELRTDVMLLLK